MLLIFVEPRDVEKEVTLMPEKLFRSETSHGAVSCEKDKLISENINTGVKIEVIFFMFGMLIEYYTIK